MSREWTEQQKNSIYATGGSVLVSAAAGSGKTAVLVERVIKMITREVNPIDADRLLIVTFTRAAAAEMRQRITLALNKLLEDDPYNPHLLKQKQLLYNSSISTIDSFCGDIVREYFHTLGVSHDYRIADDGEFEILSKTALDRAFEEFYQMNSDDFKKLLDAFSSKNGDEKLRETVLKICTFLSTQPFPDKWLDDMLNSYSERCVAKSIWGKIIIDFAHPAVSHAINLTQTSIKLIEEDEKLQNSFGELLDSDLTFLNVLQKKLLSDSWDDIVSHLQTFVTGRLTAPRGYKDNPIKIAVSDNRSEMKKTLSLLNKYFCRSEQEAGEELEELQILVSVLFELVKRYIDIFDSLKLKKNILSFSDVELLTVKLLAESDGDGYKKTTQAYEISNRYDAVMVDEFQDVNDVQNLIFNCVSQNENNLFVVGDVKQSIYGFRQAKPQIFLERKKIYNKFNGENPIYPATIILDKNFRSRKEVCDTVNFIFSRLMSSESAQMDYTKDEKLNVGAKYPDNSDCNFEISLIEKNSFPDNSTAETEALYIAKKIREIMNSDFLVKDGDEQRKATFGDFAIIMRSTKSSANTYVNTLINCGIPAYTEEKENSFEAQEIKVLLNLLRVIDNPLLDIPLLSVLCSPIYGFTPDELAQIRANDRYSSLYVSLSKYANKSQKAKEFLDEINSLRTYSYTCCVDDLIGKVMETTALAAITSAVKGGEKPLSNLNLLRVYARTFESNGYKTLSDFIQYIDKLISNGTSLPALAGSDNSTINGVRVLSIHKSKGLEYPVCFIADTAHKFNKTDLKSDVLIDSFAGLGIRKKSGLCRYNTLPRLAVETEISQNEIAEELRVLYVALTRAKEKLIVVSSVKNAEKYLSDIYSKLVFGSIIEPYAVTGCNSISDWIILSALVNPSLNSIRTKINPSAEPIESTESFDPWKFNFIENQTDIYELGDKSGVIKELISKAHKVSDDSFDYSKLLHDNITFKYKNADITNLPQKVSVSEIAHSNEYFDKVLSKPTFLNSSTATSVERGIAHHKFLQYCNFDSARKNLEDEISRLLNSNVLTETQAELIDKMKMMNLINSELVSRIINSSKVYREERFTAKIKPSVIFDEYADIQTDAYVIMQGAVDIAFVEENKLVIVDYKTDRVKDINKLLELYKKQLELYKNALSQSIELEVKECILCSIHLGEYISL